MRLPLELLEIFLLLNNESEENYLVGGCVRDHRMGIEPKDFDIVTDVHMDRIEEIFSENGWKVDDTGKQFLVMNVSKKVKTPVSMEVSTGNILDYVEKTVMYEIANFRKDGCYSDGRRPDQVEIGTIKEDAERRDFTVNALYYNPIKDEYIAPIKETEFDLRDGILRFIGNPKDRIQEDHLRVFRYYRFLVKEGLKSDPKSLKACRQYFNEAYKNSTPERVRNEIERMVKLWLFL